jgi:endonuclease-3 related protein
LGLIYPQMYERLLSAFGSQGWWPADSKFEIMIGAILTQNTAWSNVVKALDNIKRAGGLSLNYLQDIDSDSLAILIRPAGYFNQKTRYLKEFIRFLTEQCDGDLDKLYLLDMEILRKALLSVRGIGPETADDIILYAAEKPVFVIDAYTKRIMSRHLICRPDIGYDELQQIIECEVPKDVEIFKDYHGLLVTLAKKNCFKKNPDCGSCPLNIYERSIA